MTDRSSIFTLVSAAVLAGGMVLGGWVLGNGLTRAQEANRSVTVRGLAERDVTADLATWTISTTSIGYVSPACKPAQTPKAKPPSPF